MEKHDDLTLQKARSYRRVLAAGFQLYTDNFRRLFKASWLMALLYALCCGALYTLTSIKIPEMTTVIMQQLAVYQALSLDTAHHYALTLLGILGLSLLVIVTLSLASATIFSKLKEHKETASITTPPHWLRVSPRLMLRTLKGVLLTLLVLLVPVLLFAGLLAVAEAVSEQFLLRHQTTVFAAFHVVLLLIFLLALPLVHVLTKYVLESPVGYWQVLGRHYGRAMRHWGLQFLVVFVSMLLVSLAMTVVTLPAAILNLANLQAHLGLLIGDPLGMPSYILPLTFGTFTLSSFIQFYIGQVTLLHGYYLFGSIETQELEREQQRLNIQ